MAESNSRNIILASIRQSLGASAPPATIAAEYATIPRTYHRSRDLNQQSLIELFTDRLLEYEAGVYPSAPHEIPLRIAEILTHRNKSSMVIPTGLPAEWLPTGFAFNDATNFDGLQLDGLQLDKTEGILSACTAAIAETGSIVLQNAPAQGPRILSLVPDYHLCIVFANQIVATVPEAFDRLAPTSALPTTFISGPSATADIEMTRIKGVHGPRFLDVLIVQNA